MTKLLTILIIVTSHGHIGTSNEQTGVWLEELTTPYYAFKDAGYDVEIVTVSGGDVPIDPRSLNDEEKPDSVVRYLNDDALQAAIKGTKSAETIDPSHYAAVFFPGGHGTMWDYPNNETLAGIITATLAQDKPVAAVCHGPAVFVGVNDQNGDPIIKGKKISAFTDSEEAAVGLTEKVPFLLETKLTELGAKIVKTDDFQPQAIADGNIITGQNPPSSADVARLVIETLKSSTEQ